jgi:glycosyltransferase involved in cell wall biosynthesis
MLPASSVCGPLTPFVVQHSSPEHALSTGYPMLTCLWLSGIIPFPPISGARKYSARLAESLAATGIAITFVGLVGDLPPEPADNVDWYSVQDKQRGRLISLLSRMPLVSARHATPKYKAELDHLVRSKVWNIIVIDYCGMSWVLPYLQGVTTASSTLVFVTHDHEETLTRQQWKGTKRSLWQRLYLLQNHWKTRRLERATSQACDLITANTDFDAALFRRTAANARVITLTPGYDGPRIRQRQITVGTPRAVVLFGTYHWSAKQTNLRLFLEHADSKMHDAGIELRIVGDMPDNLRLGLERRFTSSRFTGFVQDPAPHLDARLGVVAEPIGGGFKHKLLDYIFHRVPVVALESCVEGLPSSVQQYVLTAPDLPALLDQITAVIDDIDRLNALQQGAFDAAERAFDWAERGRAMREAILAIRSPETSGLTAQKRPLLGPTRRSA